MKIGAGGLQSQIIEESVKVRDIDPVRNKPGHDETALASRVAGQDRVKDNITRRPVDKALKDAEVNSQIIKRKQERKEQEKSEYKGNGNSNLENKKDKNKVDIYV